MHAANATIVVHTELDIAIIAPVLTPAILNKPVVYAVLGSIANGKHCMVVPVITNGHYTRLVSLEIVVTTINGNRDWCLDESSLELVRIRSTLRMTKAFDCDICERNLVGFASLIGISPIVRIEILFSYSVLLIVVIHKSSEMSAALATFAVSIAIYILLLRKGFELAGIDIVGSFHGT